MCVAMAMAGDAREAEKGIRKGINWTELMEIVN